MNALLVVTIVLLAGTGCFAVEERTLVSPLPGLDRRIAGYVCNLTRDVQNLVSIVNVCSETRLQTLVGVVYQKASYLQTILPTDPVYARLRDLLRQLIDALTNLTCIALTLVINVINVILRSLKALLPRLGVVCN